MKIYTRVRSFDKDKMENKDTLIQRTAYKTKYNDIVVTNISEYENIRLWVLIDNTTGLSLCVGQALKKDCLNMLEYINKKFRDFISVNKEHYENYQKEFKDLIEKERIKK